jgi:hypothetical protein
MHLASFPWSGSSNKFGAIIQCLLAMKGALRGKSTKTMKRQKWKAYRETKVIYNFQKENQIHKYPNNTYSGSSSSY